MQFYFLGTARYLSDKGASGKNVPAIMGIAQAAQAIATMLALVLDVGAPEARAVQLAGECTSNRVFQQRVEEVIRLLQAGVPLTEALSRMDDTGEFRWRMENARHRKGGFMAALGGWFDALDAKAFQQEQTAAQTFTTAVVLVNGAVVGVIAISAFMILTTLIQQGVLW